jgi:hypothetical protein
MAGTVAPNIVTDGLVLYLDAANPKSYVSGSTTWTDIAAGNNGTLVNGPTFDSANGGSIVFDGSNDYVDASSYANESTWNSTFPNGLTIDVSFKLQSPFPSTSDGRSIITRNSGGDGTNAFNFSVQSNLKHRFWITNTPGILSNTTLLTNTIYNTIMCWNRTQIIYYINGILDSTTFYSPTPILSSQTYLTIGNWVATSGWQFPGNIYSLKFYNRALSASEVLQNFNSTKTRFGL